MGREPPLTRRETAAAMRSIRMRNLSVWGSYALALFLVPLIAFPLHAILQPHRLPPMRMELHIHAVSCGMWFMLVIGQSLLISNRKHKIHQKLGWASNGLAVIIVASGVMITVQFYDRTDFFAFYLGSLVSFGMFALFFVCGLVWRRSPAFHRRMMIFATISLMPAALNRVAFLIGFSPGASGPIWIVLAMLVPVYDLITMRRLTTGSVVGIAVWVAMLVVMGSFAGPQTPPHGINLTFLK